MGAPKSCKGCGKPLYVLNSMKESKARCILCGHPHGVIYSTGRVAFSRRGLEAMAEREGWRLSVSRGRRAVIAVEPIVISQPPPGRTRHWRDAEQEALEWMRANGFRDARLTDRGADGGVDIRARRAVAQVKDWQSNVGAPAVRELFGIAQAEGAKALFFAGKGYTAQAATFADAQGVARYTLSPVTPCNDHAQELERAWQRQQRKQKRREQWDRGKAEYERLKAERDARNEARRGGSF